MAGQCNGCPDEVGWTVDDCWDCIDAGTAPTNVIALFADIKSRLETLEAA
jgi:hypothetical protein